MALTIGNHDTVQTNTETAHAIKTAKLAKNQQTLEGQIAIDLISSATSALQSVAPPTAISGNNINVKV